MAESSEASGAPAQETANSAESVMNLALLDPPRFGWSAMGGVVDVLPPQDRARRSSTREAHVKMAKSREKRKERLEAARKKKEASSKIFLGTDQLSQQVMMLHRPTNSSVAVPAVDGKLPAIGPLVRKDPPIMSVNNGGSVQQQQNVSTIAQGEAPPPGLPIAAPPPPTALQTVANNIGMQAAAQGITAAAVGLASLLMNPGGSKAAPPPPQTDATAAASQSTAPFGPLVARTNDSTMSESVDNAKGNETSAAMMTAQANNNANESTAAAAAAASNDHTAATTSESDDNHAKESSSDKVLRVKALDEDGVLDMYTYHRGREGMEPRDDETGQLLCDVEPTDTNHGWEPPNMKLSVSISFPLTDSGVDEMDDNEKPAADDTRPQTRRQSQGQVPADPGVQYNETIEWDLADPKTMTPMCFAMGISEEFGLDTAQTLALAESIQKQINYFIQHKVSYKTPLTVLDANGNERAGASAHPPNLRGPPQLYGSAIGDTKPGMPIPQKMLQTMKTVRTAGLLAREPSLLERASLPPDIEPEYRDEVLRRMRQVSRREVAEKRADGEEQVMDSQGYGVCHSCSKRKAQVWTMPCKNPLHSLCSRHISATLSIFIDEGDDPGDADHCPICALNCDCRRCTRRMSAICAEMKSRCRIQRVPPEKCSCDDLFESCAPPVSTRGSEKTGERRRSGGGSKKSALRLEARVSVPKVPASDFPREVCGGRDLDPGTKQDYLTVYSAEGAVVLKDAPPIEDAKPAAAPPPPPSNGVQEDGNVDYCHTCKKHGNLLCCDFCPRAFHPDCIASEEMNAEGDWECVVCRQEKESTDDDVVTGESSLDAVCASFVDFKHSDGLDTSAHVLALIHATLLKLIDYDFGYLFRQPVDCAAVLNYKKIVKHPMDLGTIATRIVNGTYARKYGENLSWDDVLVAVLQDIELVWHNCFTFNFDGSSIYRMAEVQRRKYLKIRKRSFDHLLGLDVKQRVDKYVSECALERREMPRQQMSATSDRPTSNGRHKITIGTRGTTKKTNKIIAVLDPDTGRVVKMYSTFKGAALAAQFLLGLGHPNEFPTLSEHVMRRIIPPSTKDPSMLLFGYRWLYMDDLLNRKVKFGASSVQDPGESLDGAPPCTLEVKVGNDSYTFFSVEEAVSCPNLPDDIPLSETREKLLEMPLGEWRSICGLEWRKLEPSEGAPGTAQEKAAPGDSGDANAINKKCLIEDVSKHPFPTNVGFVKEDLITRRALAGFDSADAAHADWLETRQNSPVCPVDEPTNLDYFTSHYLDGERNIDGIIWRTAKTLAAGANASTTSNSVPQNVANSSEQETAQEDREATAGPEASLESTSPIMGTENRLPSSNGDALAGVETLPSLLQGHTAVSNPLTNGHLSSALHKTVNSNGRLLGEKRTHENDCLGSERANKKAAVCYS